MIGTALCAAVVAVEAIVLVVAGGGNSSKRHDVLVAAAVPTTMPFEQPRSVVPLAQSAPTPSVPGPAAASVVAAAVRAPAPAPVQPAVTKSPAVSQPVATVPTVDPAPAPAPLPACRPDEVAATAVTDRPSYPQDSTVNATGTIRNISGHDCTAPAYAELLWCDGGSSTCISSAGPIDPNAKPEIWPAGVSRQTGDSWQFGTGSGKFTPHPGTAVVKFTWHLSDDGAVAPASANFAITALDNGSTTSTTVAVTTSTTAGS